LKLVVITTRLTISSTTVEDSMQQPTPFSLFRSPFRLSALAAAAALVLGVSACGGGGGGDVTPATPAVTTTTFSGTAATGAALANATVSINCASGTGSTTTSATGAYAKDIASVTLPCALRAASADGTTVLYSVTTATATSATTQVANITPLTQLVVASLTGAEPATLFNGFNATTAAVVTASGVAAAQTAVLNTLAQAGIDTAGVTDLIGGALTAGSHSGYDGVLDRVQTQLTSTGTTLATLTTTVAATSPAATAPGTTVADHTPRLPASMLLKAAASNCAALRSGVYRSIDPQKNSDLLHELDEGTLDAATLTWTEPDGTKSTLTPNGNCRYTYSDGDNVVSQAGIIMGSYLDDSGRSFGISFPKQSIAVSELAGSWNAIGFEKNGTLNHLGILLSADISATGGVTNIKDCVAPSYVCSGTTETVNFTAHADGGFNFVGSGTESWTDRGFAYRSGSGDLMIVTIAGDGSFDIWTKKRTLTLPAVGSSTPGGWDMNVNDMLVASDINSSAPSPVTSVDAAGSTFTRTQNSGANTPQYSVTLMLNKPLTGFNFRPASTVTAADGSTVNVRERTSLVFPGMGISFQSVPALGRFQMSVDQ
jgi:hypothetical protein